MSLTRVVVEKKLIKSNGVEFMEDQTVEKINKVDKTTREKDNNITSGSLMRFLFTVWIMLRLMLKMINNIVMLIINMLEME